MIATKAPVTPVVDQRPWYELVAPAVVEDFVQLVHDTRTLQKYQRKHLDGMSRRELVTVEQQLDTRADELLAAIHQARHPVADQVGEAIEAQDATSAAPAIVEGGAS